MLREGGMEVPKRLEGYRDLSDEDLMALYQRKQSEVSEGGHLRDNPEKWGVKSVKTGQELSNEGKQNILQNSVERGLGDLGLIRAEMERRGLQAPTLEERGK